MLRNLTPACRSRSTRVLVVSILNVLILQGCQSSRYYLLASTATNIGVEVSQNPANQSPQAKLGYQRAELAIVPTNRSAEASSLNSRGEGAKDVPDVLIELRYGGIFDLGKSSGIYQRLAIGNTAVRQPGAAFMFARDADGNLSSDAVTAIQKISAISESGEADKAVLRKKFEGIYAQNPQSPDLAKFETAALAAGYTESGDDKTSAFRSFIGDLKASPDTVRSVRKSLESQGITF